MNYLKGQKYHTHSNSRIPYPLPATSRFFKTSNSSSETNTNCRISATARMSANSAPNQYEHTQKYPNLSFSDHFNDHMPLNKNLPPSNSSGVDTSFRPGEFRPLTGKPDPFQELETVSEVGRVSTKPNITRESFKRDPFQIKMREHSLRIFSGSVANLCHWYKLTEKYHMMFEVTAVLENVQPGKWSTEKILTLTDTKVGPRMQVLFYEIDRGLPALMVPSVVRCIGRLLARNRLQAFKVEESSEEERSAGQRLGFICNRVAEELSVLQQQEKKK